MIINEAGMIPNVNDFYSTKKEVTMHILFITGKITNLFNKPQNDRVLLSSYLHGSTVTNYSLLNEIINPSMKVLN